MDQRVAGGGDRLRDAGYRAEARWSAAGIRTSLHAGWFVVSGYLTDINRWVYDGAAYLNLWHGIGVKPIERIARSGLVAYLHRPRSPKSLVARALADDTVRPDYVLSSTPEVSRRVFSPAFGIPLSRCLPYGYPRNDHLLVPAIEPVHPLLVRDVPLWHRLRRTPLVVGYFPTWRETDGNDVPTPSLSVMAGILAARGGVLLHKAHVNTLTEGVPAEGLVLLAPEQDLNAYLPLCAVVVTDHSSVTADFALLDRPLLYFLPQPADSHVVPAVGDRVENMLPGPAFHTPEDLYEALRSLSGDRAAGDLRPDPAVAALRVAVWNGYDGSAAASIARFLDRGDPDLAAPKPTDVTSAPARRTTPVRSP